MSTPTANIQAKRNGQPHRRPRLAGLWPTLSTCALLCFTAPLFADEAPPASSDEDTSATNERALTTERLDRLEAQKATLEEDKTRLEEEMTSLEDEQAELEAEKTSLEDEQAKLEAEKTSLEEEKAEL